MVYGGKIRAVMVYLDRQKLQARGLSPLDVMKAIDDYNVFLPTGDAKFGDTDYALDSQLDVRPTSSEMGDIPLRTEHGNAAYLRDVATPKDAQLHPDQRRPGQRPPAGLHPGLPPARRQHARGRRHAARTRSRTMKARLTRPGIDLKLVMDQSVYVRQSIESLVQEGVLGAVLCSLVILLFLGQWRMTAIAVLTLPIAVLAALICLYATGQHDQRDDAGRAVAGDRPAGRQRDHLPGEHPPAPRPGGHARGGGLPRGQRGGDARAGRDASARFLVLAPLALMPGLGEFLFRPMALAVAFAMISAYILSRTLVPARAAGWLKPHAGHGHGGDHGHGRPRRTAPVGSGRFAALGGRGSTGGVRRAAAGVLDVGIAGTPRLLDRSLAIGRRGRAWPSAARGRPRPLARLRREFFPEVDAGAFEMYVRAPSGTRIEETEEQIAEVEEFVRKTIARARPAADHLRARRDRRLVGRLHAQRRPDGRGGQGPARPSSGATRPRSTSTCSAPGSPRTRGSADLEFAFDAGGMIRAAMNEGKSTPINVRVTGKDQAQARAVAAAITAQGRRGSTAWSTPGSSSGSTTRSTSSTSTAPRRPTSG